jgi:diguanylate cyclase (GGDEF)-like protein
MNTNSVATEGLREIIDIQINLPSPPAIAVNILNTIQNENSSVQDLEKIISADPALCSKMLRIANSAFYSIPHEINNINRALTILGTNVIKNIALSFVIADKYTDKSEESLFSFDYFWRRSVTAAVAAKLVSEVLGRHDEDIFVTALLQDIGILTLYLIKGQEYAKTIKDYRTYGCLNLISSEREKYSYDHQLLGGVLLDSWNIPTSITTPLRFHHEPNLAPEEYRDKAVILNIANLLSMIYSGRETVENVNLLEQRMQDYFGIDTAKTREILDDVARKSIEILEIFDISSHQIKPYSVMLQEANDELGKLNLSYEQLVLELKQSKEKSEKFAHELRAANAKLEQLAFRDGLTNLCNHRYFQEALSKELARAKRYGHHLSLILFDIDFFKKINDTYGHPAGDKVLVNLANIISSKVRPSDIVSRYGGEEFAVILPETSLTGLKVFSERLRRCAAAAVTELKEQKIKITISCGGAHMSPDMDISKQLLIDTADRGLYFSKSEGRNRVTILPIPDKVYPS